MTTPELDNPRQLNEARDAAWMSLQDRNESYPIWADKLHERILYWLDGESIEYVEYGWGDHGGSNGDAWNAREADRLWLFVLTGRFALRVHLGKRADSNVHLPEDSWQMVDRNSLKGLEVTMPTASNEPFGPTLTVDFDGIDGSFTIPARERSAVVEDRRRNTFRGLRDNLFAKV